MALPPLPHQITLAVASAGRRTGRLSHNSSSNMNCLARPARDQCVSRRLSRYLARSNGLQLKPAGFESGAEEPAIHAKTIARAGLLAALRIEGVSSYWLT